MTVSLEGSDPHLPRELERAIFQLAALRRPKSIPVLMLVARRVKEWLDPILFQTLEIRHKSRRNTTAVLSCTFAEFEMLARNRAAVGGSLRNARLWHLNEKQQHALLALAPNIEKMYIYSRIKRGVPAARAPLELVKLTRLITSNSHLEDQLKTLTPTNTCFSHLTHLDVFFDTPLAFLITPTDAIWREIAALPALTHVASASPAASASPIISILASAERLRLIVFRAPVPYCIDSEPLRPNVQVVLLVSSHRITYDCEYEFLGAENMWDRAERFLQQQAAMKSEDKGSIVFLDERKMKPVGDTF